ncbi:MAG: hypothetical protein Q8W49_12745 [Candidatus Palauibacterales bacterium]|nr:hypothetical protein [Candidatus Palauibacterales bacterium]
MKTRWGWCIAVTAGLVMAGTIATPPAALRAQEKAAKHLDIPTVAARPEDVASPDALVKADLASISGDVGVPRQWGRDLSLYDEHAYFVSAEKDPKTGKIVLEKATPREYAERNDAGLVSTGFMEHEIAHKTYRFGNVATVVSSYETHVGKTGSVARGVNIYQTYFDGKRWWILSIVWDSERPDNPIPADLLQKP